MSSMMGSLALMHLLFTNKQTNKPVYSTKIFLVEKKKDLQLCMYSITECCLFI